VASRGGEARCPVCHGVMPRSEEGPERGPRFAPMCSLRCKRIDLATWLGEGYRIAGEPAEPEDENGDRHSSGEEA
jgi:endogenous inhibitor of DNA gyrase (YacG/DUF329 family)